MNTKVTVLVDNVANGELEGEWGLSLLIEYRDKKILLDAGSSELFATNMSKLGLDITGIDYATLSHAHYDHANGMTKFLQENKSAKLYIRETTSANCYAKKFIFRKYIGIPRHILKDYSDRVVVVSGDYRLLEGVYLLPHKTEGLEKIGKREMMYQKTSFGYKPDNFSHEQSLVLDTEKGLLIINCCCHGGVVNIVNEVRQTFPDKKIYGIIGGFHLFNKSDDEVRDVASKIKETGIEFLCTGHCTKQRAYNIIKDKFGENALMLRSGLAMEFNKER